MINMILFVLPEFLKESPFIITSIGCVVAALVLWKRAPSASHYVLLACGFSLALAVMYPVAWWCVRALGAQTQSTIGVAFSVGWSIARSICTILLVFAVYVGRRQPNNSLQATAAAPASCD
jgi:hypothetical protein